MSVLPIQNVRFTKSKMSVLPIQTVRFTKSKMSVLQNPKCQFYQIHNVSFTNPKCQFYKIQNVSFTKSKMSVLPKSIMSVLPIQNVSFIKSIMSVLPIQNVSFTKSKMPSGVIHSGVQGVRTPPKFQRLTSNILCNEPVLPFFLVKTHNFQFLFRGCNNICSKGTQLLISKPLLYFHLVTFFIAKKNVCIFLKNITIKNCNKI